MEYTKKVSFDVKIEKSQEKSYIKIPLEVMENVERIDISYDYKGANLTSRPIGEKNVIDLAVLNPSGADIGATGSDYKSVWFGEAESSPGYKTLKLTPGTWFILIGAYMIESGGVIVSYNITYHFKHDRWLKGDPHTHTVNSDGTYNYYQLANLAKKKGVDFIIITDHNNTIYGGTPKVNGLTIIDGVEFTNYSGHFNFWGVASPYSTTHAVNNFEEFLKLNKEATEKGALRIINHPTSACPWLFGTDFDYDGIEVFNGPLIRDNLSAITYWENELKKGKKIVAVAGSDFHKISFTFGVPIIAVYANSASKDDILKAVKEGKVVVLTSIKAPLPVIKSGEVVAGGTVKLKKDTTVTIDIPLFKKGQDLYIFDNSGEIYHKKANKTQPFSITLDVNKPCYVRAEVRKKPNFFIKIAEYFIYKALYPGVKPEIVKYTISSLTNPIYFE